MMCGDAERPESDHNDSCAGYGENHGGVHVVVDTGDRLASLPFRALGQL